MKNMDLWRCNARISWYLQFFSLIFYGTLMIVILAVPLPGYFESAWVVLLSITLLLALLAQKRLISMGGEITIRRRDDDLKMIYNLEEWLIEHKPLMLKGMVFFKLRSLSSNKRKLLILAHDNMTPEAWDSLNDTLLQLYKRE